MESSHGYHDIKLRSRDLRSSSRPRRTQPEMTWKSLKQALYKSHYNNIIADIQKNVVGFIYSLSMDIREIESSYATCMHATG